MAGDTQPVGPDRETPAGGREGRSRPPDEEIPVGPFPNWTWVYGTVLVYGALVILGLWVLSRILDPGVTS